MNRAKPLNRNRQGGSTADAGACEAASAPRNICHGRVRPLAFALAVAVALAPWLIAIDDASAQQPRPAPADATPRVEPGSNGQDDASDQPEANGVEAPAEAERDQVAPRPARNDLNRREDIGSKVVLAFNDVNVLELIPFIVEATGKVVIPTNMPSLQAKTITLVHDEEVDRHTALDMLFAAFRLNEIAVIEKADRIILADLTQVLRTGDLPVLQANVDVMPRTDLGTVVIKIFKLVNANVEMVGERIAEMLPDYASHSIDVNSNQIVVVGDIALMQQVQQLITELDNNYIEVRVQTFRLAHADATEIANNIFDLFEGAGQTARPQQPRAGAAAAAAQRRAALQAGQQPGAIGPQVEMRVTVNVQNNSVTVHAEPSVVAQIAKLIDEEWDLPRPEGTSKVYDLLYSDPIIVRDTLREVLGLGGATAGGAARPGGTGAGRTDVTQTVSGIYRVEAIPSANRLIVLSKTEESLNFLDGIIRELDRPSYVGLPVVIQLKHADAVALSEELNALLQESGGGANIPRPATGLTGRTLEEGGGIDRGAGAGEAGRISFPWQGRAREDRSPESALIGQSRIVPIVRQNALAILAPVAKQQAMRELIEFFDKPGRQVMISAIVAEVTLSDATALGLRLSSSPDVLAPRNVDFGLGAGAGISIGEESLFGSLFDSSVLDANINLNLFIQALARKQAVRVLQQPRIFTSDNQEAQFFDGQDVPFLTGTQSFDTGTVREEFERRSVGVRLNVRPRITVEGDVDLEINLELSRVVPGTTGTGLIVDRRETTTQVIVKNGQTIVLSGILSESEQDIRRKVPILGDIPILNLLFSSRDRETVQTELIAFITPQVVDSPNVNFENFNVGERERLREMSRPMRELKREGDIIRDRIIDPVDIDPDSLPGLTPQDDQNGVFDPRRRDQ
jgi:type II secretion system protein D